MTRPPADDVAKRLELGYEYGPRRGPLTNYQVKELGDYNQRRSKGIVHDPAYVERMAALQERWNKWASEQVGTLTPTYRSWLRRWFG